VKNLWDVVAGIFVPVGNVVHYVRVNGAEPSASMTLAEYEEMMRPRQRKDKEK